MAKLRLDAETMAATPEDRLRNVMVLFGMGRDES